MKTIYRFRLWVAAVFSLVAAGFLLSCEDDEGLSKKITVNQIFLHTADSTTGVITEARVGTLVRIDGSGFATLQAVYVNGTEAFINPNFVTEHSILFSLPTTGIKVGVHAGEDVRNTIRLVTKHDDYSFPFSVLTRPPAAVNDSYTVGHDETLTVSKTTGVLANDVDQDGDALTATLVSTTSNGSLTLNEDGSFVYTPNPGYTGDDSFTYSAGDGNAVSPTAATVSIKVVGEPGITGVSHNLAKVGETVIIYGFGFAEIDTVIFPGDKILRKANSDFTVNSQFSAITCKVPSGVTKGPLVLKGGGKTLQSSNYMFRNECLVINWSSGYGGSFGDLTPLSATKTAVMPVGGDPSSPAGGYRHCPNTDPPSTTTLAVYTGASSRVCGFNFNVATAAQQLINNTGGLITASTPCKDLALQMDFYIPVPWGSGYFQVNFKPGDATYNGVITPQWVTIGNGQDITLTGWQTATLPLANVPSLELATVQDVINTLNANGHFLFRNTDLTVDGTTYSAKTIANFQIFMGHLRIVPYTKPE